LRAQSSRNKRTVRAAPMQERAQCVRRLKEGRPQEQRLENTPQRCRIAVDSSSAPSLQKDSGR
jgi:hypothetical protein